VADDPVLAAVSAREPVLRQEGDGGEVRLAEIGAGDDGEVPGTDQVPTADRELVIEAGRVPQGR